MQVPAGSTRISRASASARAISSTNSGLPRGALEDQVGDRRVQPVRAEALGGEVERVVLPAAQLERLRARLVEQLRVLGRGVAPAGAWRARRARGSPRRTTSRSRPHDAESSQCASSIAMHSGCARASSSSASFARGLDAPLVLQRGGRRRVGQIEPEHRVQQRRRGADAHTRSRSAPARRRQQRREHGRQPW